MTPARTKVLSPVLIATRKRVSRADKRLTFDEAIQRLKLNASEVRRRLSIIRAGSALGKRAVENIYSESRLPWSTWKRLFYSVLGAPGSPKSIEEAISTGLRKDILAGPELPPPHPLVYGRATTTDRFCWHLFQNGCFATYSAAKRWVNSKIGKPPVAAHSKLRNKKLGAFLMWSTYNRITRSDNPFFEKPPAARMMRGLLGLPEDGGKPLLLLEYRLPPTVPPLVPTIADAYAGALTYYFSVMPASEASPGAKAQPTTLPWQEYEFLEPRPEIVHEVIYGRQLSAPLEELL